MRPISNQSLYVKNGERKYLTTEERQRFLDHTYTLPQHEGCFCRLLLFAGLRISEALSLQASNLDLDNQIIAVRSLKKGALLSMRIVPIPDHLAVELSHLSEVTIARIWTWGRTKAWAVVSGTMQKAEIEGVAATPRGLRHTFGTHAVMSGVPITLLQRWMGHAKLETTAIYTSVVGAEERKIARRMW